MQLQTTYFGNIRYQPESLLEFPAGLPGFEGRRRFLPIRVPESEPLVFLQNDEDASLCFVTVPMSSVDPSYKLEIGAEERQLIGLGVEEPVPPGILCLAIVSVKESGPTANLLAPIVVNLANQRAVQAIAHGSPYSWEHPLPEPAAAAC